MGPGVKTIKRGKEEISKSKKLRSTYGGGDVAKYARQIVNVAKSK